MKLSLASPPPTPFPPPSPGTVLRLKLKREQIRGFSLPAEPAVLSNKLVSYYSNCTARGHLPLCGLQHCSRNKQRSPSDSSFGEEFWIHVPLVHGFLVESDDVIVRADLEGVVPVFIQIRSFYLLLLCPRRLLNQKKN